MCGEASSSRPQKNNSVEDLDPDLVRFLNGELDEEFPQSPVEYDNAIVEESFDDEHSGKGKEPVQDNGKGKEPVRDKGKEPIRNKGKGKEPVRDKGKTTQKVIATRRDSTKQTSPFFRLPFDIRNLIYRNLLVSDSPLLAGTGGTYYGEYAPRAQGHDLQPQFLLTNRQIHSECLDMLFDDNIFQLSVYELHNNHNLDGRCNPYLSQLHRRRSQKFQFLKRIKIVISHANDRHMLQFAIETTARVLTQQMSRLTHLTISVEPGVLIEQPSSDLFIRYSMIHGLTIIRNISRVTIEGIASDYAAYLTKKLTTASPLPKMYYDLELFAGGIDCAANAQRDAYEAALVDDFSAFVMARATVIEIVKEHMKHTELHLFDNDPVQQTTEEKCSEESGCRHCLPPGAIVEGEPSGTRDDGHGGGGHGGGGHGGSHDNGGGHGDDGGFDDNGGADFFEGEENHDEDDDDDDENDHHRWFSDEEELWGYV